MLGELLYMVKISIIVPVYNSEQYLDRCVKSLLNQTLKDIEIIIIDDCSTDNSKNKIEKYYNQNKDKIVPVYFSRNQKQGAARNKGIEVARGEYILFVDSDDYIDNNMCQLIYDKTREKRYDVVCFDMNAVYENNVKTIKLDYNSSISGELDYNKRKYIINSRGYFTTRAYKREMLIKNNIRFPSGIFYEDSPFNFITLIYARSLAKIDKALYYYTQRVGSSSNCKNEERSYDRIYTLEFMFNEVIRKNIYENNREFVDRKYLTMMVGNIHLCLDMFDEANIGIMNSIAANLNKNIPNWRRLNEYKKLDKVSKLYIHLNNKCPRLLVLVDKLYKSII